MQKTTYLKSFFKKFLPLPLIVLPAVLISCGKLPGFSVGDQSADFVQEDTINPSVDLLFVIDNSGSMQEEQTNLSNSFSAFITEFASRNLDFHVGIISTDTITSERANHYGYPNWWSETGPGGWGNSYTGIYNAGPGGLLSKSPTLSYLEPSQGVSVYVPQFQDNVQLGIDGNGGETPLLAIQEAISPALNATGMRNAGFFRENAGLAVIIVSDEDESVSGENAAYLRNTPSDETARLDQIQMDLLNFKNNETNLVGVHVITNPSAGACADSWDVGETLVKFANRFNGVVANICNDFSESLDNIGENILSLLTRFELPQPVANTNAVIVTVDGGEVPMDPSNGWSYIEENNGTETRYYIQFNGSEIPPSGSSINVAYIPGAPV